jgi:hypothetical protein
MSGFDDWGGWVCIRFIAYSRISGSQPTFDGNRLLSVAEILDFAGIKVGATHEWARSTQSKGTFDTFYGVGLSASLQR